MYSIDGGFVSYSLVRIQEWKGLMNGILSEEAGKLQAEFDNASARVADWRQQAAGTYTISPCKTHTSMLCSRKDVTHFQA